MRWSKACPGPQKFLVGFLIGGAVFGVVGWFLPSPVSPAKFRGGVLRLSSAEYQYIHPLLACEIGSPDSFVELAPIKNALLKTINEGLQGGARNISVYFRELDTSKWFAINGDSTYAPASLLKTFVMMAYYKEANETDNPALLQAQILFEGSANPAADTPGEIIPHFVSGKLYTVEQLIEQMIVYSDNDALNTLVDHFSPQTLNYFQLIFKDLNIPSPAAQSESSFNFMSVDNYAVVFRVLFSSTYLSERYSERALALLSQAHYKDGLVSGVPAALTVAHKFGVTTLPATSTIPALHELHDCGIVYYPGHPYLLCVMTEGESFPSLQTDIQKISSVAYDSYKTFLQH